MTKTMLIDAAHPDEVRVAVISQKKIEDFDFESAARKPLRGNIYLARVTRVEPSLQAAFVEYGGNRHGFLAFNEIHPDYYQIPVSDRQLLQEAEAKVAELASALELAHRSDEDDEDDDLRSDDDKAAIRVDDAEREEDDEEAGPAEDAALEPRRAVAEDDDEADEDAAADGEDAHQDALDAFDDSAAPRERGGGDDSEEEEEEEEEEERKKKRRRTPKRKSAKAKAEQLDCDALAQEDARLSAADVSGAENETARPPEDEKADLKKPDEELEEQEPAADAAQAEDAAESESESVMDDEAAAAAATDKKRKRKKKAREGREALFERYKEAKRKRSQLLRNYKIQEVIKRRQILLVQVVKEERGNKGAALTTYLSLAGRYCVLMPNTARGGGISRKIANASDRRRLRRVVDSLEVPQGMGLIIRTAGAKRTKTEIKRDYDYLLRLWENIRTLTLKSIAPCLIYEEASLIKRAIRDLYDKDISKVLVEGEAGYREAKDFMKMLMPSHAKNVQPYKERAPIFFHYGVESQLDGMYQPSVRLKSGGYIVIHQTEALVAIDVNSGRATRERNIEQTALRTNIEAAEEAARQFRLRDLAGLIVIDFIDMEEPRNNRKVEKAFKDAIKADRARIQSGRISAFGLMELSRQRRRSGIVYGTTHACPTCSGAGVIRSHEMAALRILRAIEGEAIAGKAGKIIVQASQDVCLHVLNHNRDWLNRIELDNGVEIEILADAEKAGDGFELEKSGAPRERASERKPIRADQTEPVETAEPDAPESEGEQKDAGKRRRRRRSRKDARAETSDGEEASAAEDGADAEARDGEESAEDSDREDSKPKRRRRRGRRGGRRARRVKDADGENAQERADDDSEDTAPATDAQFDQKSPEGEARGRDASRDAHASQAPAEPRATAPAAEPDANEARPEVSETASRNGAHEPDAALETEGEPPTAEAAGEKEPPADARKKSTRKGWWQRALS